MPHVDNAWLRHREGCPPASQTCFGPVGDHWTLFDTPVGLLWPHLLAALTLALGLAWLLKGAKRPATVGGVALVAFLYLFVSLACLFPIVIQY